MICCILATPLLFRDIAVARLVGAHLWLALAPVHFSLSAVFAQLFASQSIRARDLARSTALGVSAGGKSTPASATSTAGFGGGGFGAGGFGKPAASTGAATATGFGGAGVGGAGAGTGAGTGAAGGDRAKLKNPKPFDAELEVMWHASCMLVCVCLCEGFLCVAGGGVSAASVGSTISVPHVQPCCPLLQRSAHIEAHVHYCTLVVKDVNGIFPVPI